MHIVVTGAAGMIGANIIKALNARGNSNIIAVDNLTRGDKFKNLVDCEIAHYVDKQDFKAQLAAGAYKGKITAVLHQGACSDTMEHDGKYMMANNYQYSVDLLDYCQEQGIPFLYASSAAVYGGNTTFREELQHEAPLNVYGYSKFLFDQVVRRREKHLTGQVAGFRYFNVYGPRESHKGRMASVAFHHFNQYRQDGKVRIFEGHDGYSNGGQLRDFIHVDDVVKVNLWFLDHPEQSGIFNVGTGRAQPFNDIGFNVVNTCRARDGLAPMSLDQMVAQGVVEYIPFPQALVGKYQSFTQADISRLRAAGYTDSFQTVAEGVARYGDWYLERMPAPPRSAVE